MKKAILVCFLLFSFLYVSIGCEDDKGGSYSMTGTVTNVVKQPMSGRVLKCITYHDDLRIKNDTLVMTTGANGEFSFRGLHFGNYQLLLMPLDTLDSIRTFTDENGLATRKLIYGSGLYINGLIGMQRNEIVHDTLLSASATSVKIDGLIAAFDTLVSSTGADSIVSRASGAVISMTQFPGKNWSNPIFRTTANDTGGFEIGGIPRVNIVSGVQVPFVFNCRFDRAGFQSVEIDSIVADQGTISLGKYQMNKQ